MSKELEDILKLSVAERILLVEAIWDSIPVEDRYEISDEHKQILEERLANHKADPGATLSWDELKSKLFSEL